MSTKKPPPTVYEDDDGSVPAAAQAFPHLPQPAGGSPLPPMPRAGFAGASGGPKTRLDEDDEVAERLMGFMVVLQSRTEEEYRYYRLRKGVNWIGRFGSRAAVELRDGEVSEQHAIVISTNRTTRFVDLDSSNGSFVNGEKTEHAELKEGDMLKIGRTTLVFVPFPYVAED